MCAGCMLLRCVLGGLWDRCSLPAVRLFIRPPSLLSLRLTGPLEGLSSWQHGTSNHMHRAGGLAGLQAIESVSRCSRLLTTRPLSLSLSAVRCCVAAWSYLLNPVSVMSCAALSLVTFTNLLLTAALASAAQGTSEAAGGVLTAGVASSCPADCPSLLLCSLFPALLVAM